MTQSGGDREYVQDEFGSRAEQGKQVRGCYSWFSSVLSLSLFSLCFSIAFSLPAISLSLYLSLYLAIHLSICPFISLSISVRMSVFVCVYVCVSLCRSVHFCSNDDTVDLYVWLHVYVLGDVLVLCYLFCIAHIACRWSRWLWVRAKLQWWHLFW